MGNNTSNDKGTKNINLKDISYNHTISSFMKKANDPSKKNIIVKIMMPLYYSSSPLTQDEMVYATLSWNNILNNTSNEYKQAKRNGQLDPTKSCREWLEIIFYQRLFDVHPACKAMFTSPDSQGKFLTSLFSFIFTVLDDEDKFNRRLEQLAQSHCKRGVKACEYAVIGEVMFWSLSKILGPSMYDINTHNAWVKIFSMMLNIIVPISVEYELKDNKSQTQRLLAYKNRESSNNIINTHIESSLNMIKKKPMAITLPEKCPYGFKSESTTKRIVPVKTEPNSTLTSPLSQ